MSLPALNICYPNESLVNTNEIEKRKLNEAFCPWISDGN